MENGEILSMVLENITKVSFRDLAELKGEDSKLFDKHYLIHTVEQVLKIANDKLKIKIRKKIMIMFLLLLKK